MSLADHLGFQMLPPRPLTEEQRAELFAPRAQIKAALDYVRRRHDETSRAWRDYTRRSEDRMQDQTTLAAPDNPYRRGPAERYEELTGMGWAPGVPQPAPRRHDGNMGPGLVAADLDRLCRQHYLDGYAAAEREGEAKVEEARGQLAQAFDEGYTAGRVERATGLARDFSLRLIGLMNEADVRRADRKASLSKRIEGLRKDIIELHAFACGLMGERRAAGQLARDEG